MTRLAAVIDGVVRWLGIAILCCVTIVMLAQVFFRYVLNDSLLWSEELAVWGLIWIVFLGSVHLMRGNLHVSIPGLVDILPPTARRITRLAATLISACFLGLFFVVSLEATVGGFHTRSPSMGISTQWAKLIIPISTGLMTLIAVLQIARGLRNRDADDPAVPPKDP